MGFPKGTVGLSLGERTWCHSLVAYVFYIIVMKGLVHRDFNPNPNPQRTRLAIAFRHLQDCVVASQVTFGFLH